jgi:hypothetical protein
LRNARLNPECEPLNPSSAQETGCDADSPVYSGEAAIQTQSDRTLERFRQIQFWHARGFF